MGKISAATIRLLMVGLALAFIVCSDGPARAQEYPSRPITLVVGSPAGSSFDVVARFLAEKIRAITKQTVIVDNKPGAQANIAAEYTARSKPDGYTILLTNDFIVGNKYMFNAPPIDVLKSLMVVATTNRTAMLLVVDAQKPWKNVAELTQYLRDQKGQGSYSSTNVTAKVIGELYKNVGGFSASEVSYRQSSDALNDLASGAVTFALMDPLTSLARQRDGKLRLLAVSTDVRLKTVPDVPTMTESGMSMDVPVWTAIFAPSETPRAIAEKLNSIFAQVLALEETVKFLNGAGVDVYENTLQQSSALMRKADTDWEQWVRIANIPKQ